MSVSSVGAGPPAATGAPAGRPLDPETRRAQVNAQAALLQAMQSTELPMKLVLAKLNDGQGIDLYA